VVTGITGTEHQSILEHKSYDGAAAEIPGGVQGETVYQNSESDEMAPEDEDTDTAYLLAIEVHEAQRCASSSAPYVPAVPAPRGALVPKLELSVMLGAGRDASGPAAVSSAGEAGQDISGASGNRCEPGRQEVLTEKRGTRGIVAMDEARRFLGHAPLVARPALIHAPALKPHTENKNVVTIVPTGSAAHTALTTAAAGTSPPPPRSELILCSLIAFFPPQTPDCFFLVHG
jgi:hypothetical protein